MNNSSKRQSSLLILITSICVIPLLLAWLLYRQPQWINGTVNYGHLIVPAVKIDRNVFTGLDEFSKKNIAEFKGRWVMMHFITVDGCGPSCTESLYNTKRIRLMLNKDLLRVRRLLVVSDKIDERQAVAWWVKDETLLRVRARPELFDRVSTLIRRPLQQGMLFLMDPLGNLMMWYEPGYDPYGVKKDMKKLLNVSQIG